jgi:LCP family protein required for cell wall assembly
MASEEQGSASAWDRSRWLALAGLIAAFLVVCAAAYLAPVLALFSQRDASPPPRAVVAPAATPPPLDASHRVNVLLLGSDNDQKFKPDAVLTQTMIVASIDPAHHQLTLLSIPRDLWVDVPGHGPEKIDAAYQQGGAALARATVEARLRIPIHYYAWVGLSGLIAVIDRMGGVDVDVLHPILDDTYPNDLQGSGYGYTRVYIPAGPQHLDGVHALEYVRSRHGDLLSDFGRSTRQQQVLLALHRRMSAIDLLAQAPAIARDLNGHVKTDLDLLRAGQLAFYLRGLGSKDVRQVYLLPPLVTDARSADGQEILVPNWPLIGERVREIFGQDLLG